MIDIEKAKEEFFKYTNQFDLNNPKLKNKQNHCLRVMENCKEISESLNMSEDEINLASLIGLIHDIAKFEQYKQYQTFSDAKSFDHGDMAIEYLNNNNYIRSFIETDIFDEIIYKAIRNHNKFKIEDDLSDKELIFAKIIRDADKIDIFYEIDSFFYDTQDKIDEVNNSILCNEYYNQFINEDQILKKKDETAFDRFASTFSFIFDINFDVSFDLIKNRNYCQKTISSIHFENEDMQEKYNNIIKLFYKYINKEV